MSKTKGKSFPIAASKDLYDVLAPTQKEKPTKEAIQAVRRYWRDHPEAWREVGDMAKHAREVFIEDKFRVSAGFSETVRAAVAGVMHDLGYETAPPIERMVIEEIGLSWLHHYVSQWELTASSGVTMRQQEMWERRNVQLQRRYLRALETLARIRRMKLPAVQVNIGQNQVNIAGSVAGVAGSLPE